MKRLLIARISLCCVQAHSIIMYEFKPGLALKIFGRLIISVTI